MPESVRLCAAGLTWFVVGLSAQAVVLTGTGDPTVDIPAVQAAVNQGGRVIMSGHFSFDAPPTTPVGETYARMITISRKVEIQGSRDGNGELTTIEGGFIPFFGEALGASISIRGLHFVRAKAVAIWIYAASGVVIADCNIDAVAPSVVVVKRFNRQCRGAADKIHFRSGDSGTGTG